MSKLPLVLFALLLTGCALLHNPSETPVKDSYAVMAPVLDSAETFFISLKDRQYGTAWDLLSKESRKTIINNIYEASKKLGEDLQKDDIKSDFEKRGLLFNTYWDAFLESFDPDMVLKESRWDMGFIDNDKAEINILHKRSKLPARLQMYKENGAWKVGTNETFGTRKF